MPREPRAKSLDLIIPGETLGKKQLGCKPNRERFLRKEHVRYVPFTSPSIFPFIIKPLNERFAISHCSLIADKVIDTRRATFRIIQASMKPTSLLPEITLSKARVSHASYARGRDGREKGKREGRGERNVGARGEIDAGFLGNPRDRKTRGRLA